MRRHVSLIVYRVNIVRPICNNLVGKHHTFRHRLVTGIVVMVVGVVIAKTVGHSENELVAILGDGLGYGLHGLGLTPIVEAMLETFEEAV